MTHSPTKMQALVTTVEGKEIDDSSNLNDVLKMHEVAVRELKGWEAIVEVRHIALGPADVTCLRVQQKGTTPGFDLAGVVIKDKSGKHKEGDRVFGIVYGGLVNTIKDERIRKEHMNNGSFATYAIVHSDLLVRIPENQSFEKAAALPFCTLLAYQALSESFTKWPVEERKHESILIAGGSTSIGLSAIQLAHRMGYRVVTTTSQKHFDLCKEYGADQCFNFKEENVDKQIRENTQNALAFAIDTVNQGNSLPTAYRSIGASGGEVVTLVPRYQNEMELQRSEVGIKARLPTTLWGTEATWQGMNFEVPSRLSPLVSRRVVG
ncbi:hypothetical protein BDY24DRAFT_391950 [Mrakia frigida]|uniref:uncharacterized protein n=1 Tax=Mrakia frigida TaxID=29902 RepID=UPI003FCBF2D4